MRRLQVSAARGVTSGRATEKSPIRALYRKGAAKPRKEDKKCTVKCPVTGAECVVNARYSTKIEGFSRNLGAVQYVQ